jgi:hypothetical protein
MHRIWFCPVLALDIVILQFSFLIARSISDGCISCYISTMSIAFANLRHRLLAQLSEWAKMQKEMKHFVWIEHDVISTYSKELQYERMADKEVVAGM